jgi:hypothetical protein
MVRQYFKFAGNLYGECEEKGKPEALALAANS